MSVFYKNAWLQFIPMVLASCWCENWFAKCQFWLHLKQKICSWVLLYSPVLIMVDFSLTWSWPLPHLVFKDSYDILKWLWPLPPPRPQPPLYWVLLRYTLIVISIYIDCTFWGHYFFPSWTHSSISFLIFPYLMGSACCRYEDALNISTIAHILLSLTALSPLINFFVICWHHKMNDLPMKSKAL